MRVASGSLGVFVPGRPFTLPQNPFTGMAGVDDFVGGRFTLPQNPFAGMAGVDDFVGGRFTLPQNPFDGVGDLTPTAPLYPIPVNSVLAASGMGCYEQPDDCGCGCGGGCGGGISGLGCLPWQAAAADGTCQTTLASFSALPYTILPASWQQSITPTVAKVVGWGAVLLLVVGPMVAKRRRGR